MKFLSQSQISTLVDIEAEYRCDFYYPPLLDKLDCCFFDIDKIQHNAIKFREFLIKVKETGVKHKFMDVNGKKFMAVMS